MSCTAILLAAGSSKRLGFDKILTLIAGKPVVQYSLDALMEADSVKEIILTTRKDLLEKFQELVKGLKKTVKVIEGGVERQDSVWNGLQHAKNDFVLIHDAARPMLTAEIVEKLLAEAKKIGSAICAQRATDTLKRATGEGVVLETLNRAEIWLMQTPQVFRKDLIFPAYEHVQKNKIAVTDDAAAVEILGQKAQLVDVGAFNLKITRSVDWKLVNLWLKQDSLKEIRKAVHEVCNQINPMVGYLPLLERYGGKDEKFKGYLGKIKDSTAQLQTSLQRLQQIAREACSEEGQA